MTGEAKMRWTDRYLMLIAATLVFGASVSWAAGTPLPAPVALLTAAAALVLVAAWRHSQTTRVAVVGMRNGDRLRALEAALDDAGLAPRVCFGPEHHPCPVLADQPCPVRGHPAAAVVYVPAGQTGPLPPCGRGLGVPVLAVAEDPAWASDGKGSQRSLPWEHGLDAGDAVRRLLVSSRRSTAA
jgi:hypothetical protein